MNANATERESDFTTVLELASQVRAEAKRQRNWCKAKVKVGSPLTVLPHSSSGQLEAKRKKLSLSSVTRPED